MRKAKDGKEYDIDNLPEEVGEDEVEIIQYLRPDGKRRRMIATVGKYLAEKAKDMIISSEELTTGKIAIYIRYFGELHEEERLQLADNGAGEKSPTHVLMRMIEEEAKEES